MHMPEALIAENEPAGGVYRRIVVRRADAQAQQAMLSRYRRPGQYVLLRTQGDEQANYFAIARAPVDSADGFEFLVKPEGAVAETLGRLAAGTVVEMSDPVGDGYPLERAKGRDLLILAAGSGIGPLRALIDELRQSRDDFGFVRLYYGQAQPDEFAYRNWLAALPESGVEVTLVASKPSIDHRGPMGYVQDVADTDANFAASSRLVVAMCGMPAMERAARQRLAARGVAVDRILTNL